MQDLMEKLQGILNTKEGQAQLGQLASMLNMNGSSQKSEPAPVENPLSGFDFSSLAGMFSNSGGANDSNSAQQGNGFQNNDSGTNNNTMPNIDINMILKLQQAFSAMNVSDKNSQLLLALKPHFSDERKKKVDQAITMMRLLSMLPMLKESGILSGLGL